MTITFIVPGEPVAQGSMQAFLIPGTKRASMHASNAAELNAWRKQVALAATIAAGGRVAAPDLPVTVRAEFRFSPPAKMPKGRVAMTVAPDADKLLRACLDAMTLAEDKRGNKTGVYVDDKQVVDAHAVKAYATPVHPPGAYIEVDFAEGLL